MDKKIITEKNGITLIALVITIIVLLILAGISISMLSGDNSILNRATEAKDATRGGEVQQAVAMAVTNNSGAEHLGGPKQTKKDVIKQLRSEEKLTDDEATTLEESDIIVIGGITIDFSIIDSNNWIYDHATQTVKKNNLILKIGDYVNDTGTQSISGFDGKWRVLGAQNGQLLLVTDTYYAPFEEDTTNGITRSSTGSVGPDLYGIELSGKDGYDNGEARLNKIGEQYNNSKLEKGRSINPTDINKITGFNPNNIGVNDPEQTGTGIIFPKSNALGQYKNKVTFTFENGKLWYQGTNVGTTKTESTATTFKIPGETDNITSPYQLENNYYSYFPTTLSIENDDSKSVGLAKESAAYDMLFTPTYSYYFLASHCSVTNAEGSLVIWGMFSVREGEVFSSNLWLSTGLSKVQKGGVRPVVSLKSNITPRFKSTDSATDISTYEI